MLVFKKKAKRFTIFILLAAVMLAGCGNSTSSANRESVAANNSETLSTMSIPEDIINDPEKREPELAPDEPPEVSQSIESSSKEAPNADLSGDAFGAEGYNVVDYNIPYERKVIVDLDYNDYWVSDDTFNLYQYMYDSGCYRSMNGPHEETYFKETTTGRRICFTVFLNGAFIECTDPMLASDECFVFHLFNPDPENTSGWVKLILRNPDNPEENAITRLPRDTFYHDLDFFNYVIRNDGIPPEQQYAEVGHNAQWNPDILGRLTYDSTTLYSE